VGGVVPAVRALSDMSSSDLCEEPAEEAVFDCAKRSGALYESMLVVWMSSTGLEILLRIEAPEPLELLRWGELLRSAVWRLCLTRRFVKARAIDILSLTF